MKVLVYLTGVTLCAVFSSPLPQPSQDELQVTENPARLKRHFYHRTPFRFIPQRVYVPQPLTKHVKPQYVPIFIIRRHHPSIQFNRHEEPKNNKKPKRPLGNHPETQNEKPPSNHITFSREEQIPVWEDNPIGKVEETQSQKFTNPIIPPFQEAKQLPAAFENNEELLESTSMSVEIHPDRIPIHHPSNQYSVHEHNQIIDSTPGYDFDSYTKTILPYFAEWLGVTRSPTKDNQYYEKSVVKGNYQTNKASERETTLPTENPKMNIKELFNSELFRPYVDSLESSLYFKANTKPIQNSKTEKQKLDTQLIHTAKFQTLPTPIEGENRIQVTESELELEKNLQSENDEREKVKEKSEQMNRIGSSENEAKEKIQPSSKIGISSLEVKNDFQLEKISKIYENHKNVLKNLTMELNSSNEYLIFKGDETIRPKHTLVAVENTDVEEFVQELTTTQQATTARDLKLSIQFETTTENIPEVTTTKLEFQISKQNLNKILQTTVKNMEEEIGVNNLETETDLHSIVDDETETPKQDADHLATENQDGSKTENTKNRSESSEIGEKLLEAIQMEQKQEVSEFPVTEVIKSLNDYEEKVESIGIEMKGRRINDTGFNDYLVDEDALSYFEHYIGEDFQAETGFNDFREEDNSKEDTNEKSTEEPVHTQSKVTEIRVEPEFHFVNDDKNTVEDSKSDILTIGTEQRVEVPTLKDIEKTTFWFGNLETITENSWITQTEQTFFKADEQGLLTNAIDFRIGADNETNKTTGQNVRNNENITETTEIELENITMTPENLIKLIPVIVNDLRNKTVTFEEKEIFIQVYGKLWPDIERLAEDENVTIKSLFDIDTEEKLEIFLGMLYNREMDKDESEKEINTTEGRLEELLDEPAS